MAKELKGYTHDCTISFLDLYEKVKRNAPDIKPLERGQNNRGKTKELENSKWAKKLYENAIENRKYQDNIDIEELKQENRRNLGAR